MGHNCRDMRPRHDDDEPRPAEALGQQSVQPATGPTMLVSPAGQLLELGAYHRCIKSEIIKEARFVRYLE